MGETKMNKPHQKTQWQASQERHLKYERMKREWVSANPDATCAQYDAAIRRIANQCGV